MVESLILTTLILSILIALVCLSSNMVLMKKALLTSFFACIAVQQGVKYLGFTNPKFIHGFPTLLVILN